MHPIAFHVGNLPVHWYGVMIVVAFVTGLWTAGRRGLRDGIDPEKIWDIGPWLIIGTILGARVLHVISYWKEEFAGKPWWEVFMIQHGGLVYYGGLIGASLACILYVRLKKLPLWKVADILAPSIALGYVFGRLGCLFNGCCFGKVCDVPWAIRFPNKSLAWQHHFELGLVGAGDKSLPIHPTQVYESLLSLGLYFLLAWLYRRKRFDGQIFACYLISYAVLRSFVELFRGDYAIAQMRNGLTPAQVLSILILASGFALLWLLRPRTQEPMPPTQPNL